MIVMLNINPTTYHGVPFDSRLEAQWACFFDLVEWKWIYHPYMIRGWIPSFHVQFPCPHSECDGSHTLLVEVRPYSEIIDFKGLPCTEYGYGGWDKEHNGIGLIDASSSASFGAHPEITYWEMAHGAGGGVSNVSEWIREDVDALWQRAKGII